MTAENFFICKELTGVKMFSINEENDVIRNFFKYENKNW